MNDKDAHELEPDCPHISSCPSLTGLDGQYCFGIKNNCRSQVYVMLDYFKESNTSLVSRIIRNQRDGIKTAILEDLEEVQNELEVLIDEQILRFFPEEDNDFTSDVEREQFKMFLETRVSDILEDVAESMTNRLLKLLS